jgi:hypothetical protein
VDWFTLHPHIVTGTWWDDMAVADEAVAGDTSIIAVRFTFPNLSITEGRPRTKAAHLVPATATPEQIANAIQKPVLPYSWPRILWA